METTPQLEPQEVTISLRAAQVLSSLCRQVITHDGPSKVNIGRAQMELEAGMAKYAPPPVAAPEPTNRAAKRRARKENGAAAPTA